MEQVKLELIGEQTELDKTVLEKIGDPMVHLVRNAIDHGLETPDKRRAAAQILGQAYVTAYSLMASNRDRVEQIADTLVERKEMHGDEVVEMLSGVGLRRPEINLMDDSTWPQV